MGKADRRRRAKAAASRGARAAATRDAVRALGGQVRPGWQKLTPKQLRLMDELVTRRTAIEDHYQAIARAVRLARASGITWELIGGAIGMTGEGVRKKYRDT